MAEVARADVVGDVLGGVEVVRMTATNDVEVAAAVGLEHGIIRWVHRQTGNVSGSDLCEVSSPRHTACAGDIHRCSADDLVELSIVVGGLEEGAVGVGGAG